MFDAIPTSLPHIRERRLKALAVTSPQRWPLLPEVPTFAELGYPDLTQTLASTVFAVSDVPNEAAMQLRGELLGALAEPGMLAGLKSMGLVPALNRRTVAELTQALRLEYEQTGAVLRSIQYSPST